MDGVSTVLTGWSFLESPRWRDGRLWASDFYTGTVLSARADGTDVRVEAEVPAQPSGLGWLPDGRLLVVAMREHRILRREPDGTLAVHADLAAHCGGLLNDMLVDDAGRAWVGDFGFDLMRAAPVRTTNLVRVDPDGTATVVAEDLHFPNGMVLIDGTLVVAETLGNRISAFDVRPDGSLSDRRDWAVLGAVPTATDARAVLGQVVVAPDGLVADAEGAVWAADAMGVRAVRVREGVGIVDEVLVDTGCYACTLGGEDGRTLFLATAPDYDERERRDTRGSRMLAVRVGVGAR